MTYELPANPCQVCGNLAQTVSAYCAEHSPTRATFRICGAISQSGRFGEPLACAFRPGHDGNHAWASLPTFANDDLAAPVAEHQEST